MSFLRARRDGLSYLGAWDGNRAVGTGAIVWKPSRPARPHGEETYRRNDDGKAVNA